MEPEDSSNIISANHVDQLCSRVIGYAIDVHRYLGPGLLESAYEQCLVLELRNAGIAFELQKEIPLVYKSFTLNFRYKVDLIIENSIIVELKAVERVQGIHEAQILTYMRLANVSVGLLINFNSRLLKNGIRRLYLTSSHRDI